MVIKHEESQQPSHNTIFQTRRSALKKMLVGTGVATGAVVMPEKWVKPVLNKVLIPAHAQTSVTYDIICDEVLPKDICHGGQIDFAVFGSVSASDGSSLVGASLEVSYTNGLQGGGTATVKANSGTVLVQADNTFSGPCSAVPPPGKTWDDHWGTVTVSFDDPGTYGDAECSLDFECELSGSDIRLKTDIHPLGVTNQGFKLYRFRYIKDPAKHEYVGVMAQDLTKSHPHALVKNNNGYYAVRYDLLGLKMATYKEWRQTGLKAVESHH